ncbi:sensor histidine kinase [Lachnotalea sp. AF33-28]|uniref:sensor histidine kinase n=1 Tax=Lachnotalea sp. AF33-28 TaxID=2292046 RepID=UPI00131407D0|nr:histidine kinase [Lachnotalea sp. AF33-28]
MKNNITLKKLILLFFSVIVPFFLSSMFLLQQNNAAIHNRKIVSLQEKVNLTAQTLTSALEQIYHTAAEMTGQSNLRRVATANYLQTTYEEAKDICQIQEQQTSIKNANPYINNFIIYYQDRKQAYNSSGDGRGSFFEFTEEEYQTLADARKSADFLIYYNQKLSEIILPSSGSNFLIRIDLSAASISSLLENAFTEYKFYYYLDAFDQSYQLTNLTKEQLALFTDTDCADRLTIEGTQYYRFSSSLPYGKALIHFFFSGDQLYADTKLYQYLDLCFSLFVLIICCIFLWGSYTIIQKPIQTLIHAFQNINNRNYNVRIFSKNNSDFTYLYNEFNHMAKQLGTLIEKDYQQQLLLNKAELKQLQAQINPHFLYNSLFLLRRMIQDELYAEAYHMSDTLGLYFQYITRNSQDYMPLNQEYRHAILYCEIQKLRFEGRIRVETDDLPAEYSSILVPKLIIQPILENAFNYGLRNKVDDGLLKVAVSNHDSELIISIEDNGDDLSDAQLEKIQANLQSASTGDPLREMTGILNIQRRLSIYSDGSSHLTAIRSPLGGLCIQLFLPIQQSPGKERETHDKNIVS